ncbi:MAG: DsbA family protein [Acidobacteriaceae bacterium]
MQVFAKISSVSPRIALCLALSFGIGCHAQTPAKTATASKQKSGLTKADLDRRIELMVRSKFGVPPDYTINIGERSKSNFAGYDSLQVSFSRGGKQSRPLTFLISSDDKTLARLETFDISKSPSEMISTAGRPWRGTANAPVVIVVFDDLECPFCARMHKELFPLTMDRYKGKIRVVYKDYPLVEIHPWAMHAAIDSDCLAAQSSSAYWNLVDYVQEHAGEIAGPNHDLVKAKATLDQLTRDEGKRSKLDATKLEACITKQDEAPIRASMKEGDALGVNATPTLYINGERVEGAVPTEDFWPVIDRALEAAGVTPPSTSPATSPDSAGAKPTGK